jgi:hypothetical protein
MTAPSWQFMQSRTAWLIHDIHLGESPLSAHPSTPTKPFKPGIVAYAFLYLIMLAVIVRTLAVPELRPFLPRYLGLELVYLLLYSIVLWGPRCD